MVGLCTCVRLVAFLQWLWHMIDLVIEIAVS